MFTRMQSLGAPLLAIALGLGALNGFAQTQSETQTTNRTETQTQDQTRTEQRNQTRDQIYGSQLMTRKERAEYRQRLRALKTEEQREQFRLEHHARMQERAKAKGLDLPDHPPADRAMGAGPRANVDRPGGAGGPRK